MSVSQRMIISITVLVVLCWNTGVVAGADKGASAMKQMATIMHRLKHFPSPQGKETLQNIISHKMTHSNERMLAMAMFNLDHKVIAADIANLKSVLSDGNASQSEKSLATILLNLNHRPTSEDKQHLKMMMK